MKFWRNIKTFGTLDRGQHHQQQYQHHNVTPFMQRRVKSKKQVSLQEARSTEPIYEDFDDNDRVGTTFVELIKRKGTRLGVIVEDQGGHFKIKELTQGSWAQRSDVLVVGDLVVSVNGVSTATMTLKDLCKLLEQNDRVQLEVEYPLPQNVPPRSRFTTKVIQITLKKENGSFGMVIRGGHNEATRKRRPFTVVHITTNGPTFREGTIRVNDRLRAINGRMLQGMKLPELQSLLYQQDRETVFTVEYDVAVHERIECGPVLVEIRRDVNDTLGFGLNKCQDSGHVFFESIKQASLSDRCGAVSVGDILLSVNGEPVARMPIENVMDRIRGDPNQPHVVQLEILPGLFSRTAANPFRSSLPSPCFSSLRNHKIKSTSKCQRYNSLTEIDRPSPLPMALSFKERRKFVTFTVELQRDGGPLGLTLATEEDANVSGPIFISALMHEGLAERTRTIQVNDQLVEVNGVEVREKCLNEVIPLLQECSNDVIKLKLARQITIPERDFVKRDQEIENLYSGVNAANLRKPPLPSPSPSRGRSSMSSKRDSSTSSTATISYPRDASPSTPTNQQPTVSLLPISPARSPIVPMRPVPMEVQKVTLFKDRVYEDFGFSLSDGLYEKGIFVNRIRKGGPADLSGLLRPMDRILQINETRTNDFDCCLAVPLIASAGDKIELLIARTNRVLMDFDDFDADSLTSDLTNHSSSYNNNHTLTRRSIDRRSSFRTSRTSSADGRLAGNGSLTGQIVPWTGANLDPRDAPL